MREVGLWTYSQMTSAPQLRQVVSLQVTTHIPPQHFKINVYREVRKRLELVNDDKNLTKNIIIVTANFKLMQCNYINLDFLHVHKIHTEIFT